MPEQPQDQQITGVQATGHHVVAGAQVADLVRR
jgi:hypothetical protein